MRRTLLAIPVYNEEKYVERVLGRVSQYLPNVLVLDDGSTDATPSLLAKFPVEVIRHASNRGYGRSLMDAFRWAAVDRFDWVVTMDCDEQHEPASIPDFLAAIERDNLDVISGSRYLDVHPENNAPPEERRRINGIITEELNARLGLRLTDAFCGFKAYRVSAIAKLCLDVDGYAFPMQFWVQAVAAGLRIDEVPVRLIYNDATRSFGGPLDDHTHRLTHYRDVLARAGAVCRQAAAAMSRVLSGMLESVTVRGEGETPIGVLQRPGPAKAAARAELGLPIDKHIVMVGHQAEVWHAGILAKLIVAAEIARRHGAALVWLTPDQDANEPTMIGYPAQTHEGRLKRRDWMVDAGAFVRPGTPTGSRLAIKPGAVPREARTESPHVAVRAGLDLIREALIHREGEASLARQFTLAALGMVRDTLGIDVDHVLMCSTMARGAAFRMWADRMRREARNCVLAYNGAAQAVPEAHVRDLEMGPRWELPLWALTSDRPRAAVFGDTEPEGQIVPRALAMTGFVRTLLCDAWVMGVGGEAYDAVTRRWLGAWMGKADLAPGLVATATLRLPLREGPLPDAERAARAAWRVHHAKHHPEMLGQAERQHERDRIVQAIREAPHASMERRRLFAELRGVLGDAREAGADDLQRIRDQAELERERMTDMECVLDRTWPFALHPSESLRELDSQVRAAVGVLP